MNTVDNEHAMDRRTLKIAMVVPRYGQVGGGERFVMALTEQLAAMDHLEMHVFANRWDTESPGVFYHKVPIITFPRFLKTISFAHFANRRIAAAGMDLVHTHDRIFEADLFTAHGLPHATWIRQVRRKRLSLFDHVTAWVEGRLINSTRCRKILAVSSLVKNKISAEFPEHASKIQVLTPGVDIAPFENMDRQACRARIRQRLGLSDTDRVVLFVGMNFEVKGLESIMTAVSDLRRNASMMTGDIKLLVVGKGDAKRYTGIARQLGIGSATVFTGIWHGEMAPIYAAADLFIMLSVFDTFGLAVTEAMAAGLPVIISPTVGAGDIVRQGENGFVVSPLNTNEVSRYMALALEPGIQARMAAHARQTARVHSWASMAEQIDRLYKQIAPMRRW